MLGLLAEAVPPEADDGEGGVKRGISEATSVDLNLLLFQGHWDLKLTQRFL